MTSTPLSSGLATPGKETGVAGDWAAADALQTRPAPRTSELPAEYRKARRSLSIRYLSEIVREYSGWLSDAETFLKTRAIVDNDLDRAEWWHTNENGSVH